MKTIHNFNSNEVIKRSEMGNILGGREVIRTEVSTINPIVGTIGEMHDKIIVRNNGSIKIKQWLHSSESEPTDDFVDNYGDDYYQL